MANEMEEVAAAWPVGPWRGVRRTAKARAVRAALIGGWAGSSAVKCQAWVAECMGDGDAEREGVVNIPFRTRAGKVVTLRGGYVRGSLGHVVWDVLDGHGDYRDERFPAGLSCLTTATLAGVLRNL